MSKEQEIPEPTFCPVHLLEGLAPVVKEEGVIYCNSSYDSVVCWPITRGGSFAVTRCPERIQQQDGLFQELNHHENATKYCFPDGTWHSWGNYSQCIPDHRETHADDTIHKIFWFGYSISTVALLLSLFIFCYFRSLRCLRNSIHCHLMATFTFRNILFFILRCNLVDTTTQESSLVSWSWRLAVAFYVYLLCATFFWMLVEGLYLHTMIVWAFSADKVKMWKYALLGWGGPFPVILAWFVVKAVADEHDKGFWLPSKGGNDYDWIYIAPTLILLGINVLFLASIEYVLITKLKASNSLATKQYKKAVKGTVILFPLLGLIYVILITPPGSNPISIMIFHYINSILQAFQGLLVAVFYCFLNAEVRYAIKNKFYRWKNQRNVLTNYSRNSRGASFVQRGGTECTSVNLKTTNGNVYVNDKETGENENFDSLKREESESQRQRLSSGVSETTYIAVECSGNKSPKEGSQKNGVHTQQSHGVTHEQCESSGQQ